MLKYGGTKRFSFQNYKLIALILIGCFITLVVIFLYTQKKQEVRNYYIDAEVVKVEGNVLTVKGLKSNPQYAKGTYKIKITKKIIISDWETDIKLEQHDLNEYKYVTLLFTGQENEIKDKEYLKGVSQIFCNVEKRGLIEN